MASSDSVLAFRLEYLLAFSNADIVECNFREFYSQYVYTNGSCTGDITKVDRSQAIHECICYGIIKPTAWNKLYKRSIIGDIRYPVGRLHEDEFTTHKILFSSQKIYLLDVALYNYDCSRDSSITANFKPQNLDSCEAMRQKIHFVLEHSELQNLVTVASNRYCFILFDNLSKCVAHSVNHDDSMVQTTISSAIIEAPLLLKNNIEPLYRRCLIELQKKWP